MVPQQGTDMIPLPVWFTVKNVMKALPYILVGLLLWYLLYTICTVAYEAGANSVQKKWDEVEKNRQAEIIKLQAANYDLLIDNILESSEIFNALAEAKKKHDLAVSRITADFNQRLLLSQNRADFYQRQAEGSSPQCRGLADHAGKLDASLEEGRGLVQELGAAIRLRDAQVKLLGDQIKTDRKLLR